MFSCDNSKEKGERLNRVEICTGVYLESYTIFGNGAFGGDLLSEYLTDTVNYRIKVGTHDTSFERIVGKCKGDTVVVEKYAEDEISKQTKLVEKKNYSIQALIEQGKFE